MENADAAQPIAGYRTLSDEELAAIADIKNHAEVTERMLCYFENHWEPSAPRPKGVMMKDTATPGPRTFDGRELALARTHFEDAFMHFTKAIAQPRSL